MLQYTLREREELSDTLMLRKGYQLTHASFFLSRLFLFTFLFYLLFYILPLYLCICISVLILRIYFTIFIYVFFWGYPSRRGGNKAKAEHSVCILRQHQSN